MKLIPEKYLWHDGFRTPLQSVCSIDLDDAVCPVCGQHLEIQDYGDMMWGPCAFRVGCTDCDWNVPYGFIGDYGEAVCVYREWLEAYTLMGCDKKLINVPVQYLFWDNLKKRDEEMSDYEKEYAEWDNIRFPRTLEEMVEFTNKPEDDQFSKLVWSAVDLVSKIRSTKTQTELISILREMEALYRKETEK